MKYSKNVDEILLEVNEHLIRVNSNFYFFLIFIKILNKPRKVGFHQIGQGILSKLQINLVMLDEFRYPPKNFKTKLLITL